MTEKINDTSECFYSMYQTGEGDIDNDGDIDIVFGAQIGWNNDCGLNGRHLGILRNQGDGNFDVEWLPGKSKRGDVITSEGYLLLEDINNDDYLDVIFNSGEIDQWGNPISNVASYIQFMLNDGSGSFIFSLDNKIDNPGKDIINI